MATSLSEVPDKYCHGILSINTEIARFCFILIFVHKYIGFPYVLEYFGRVDNHENTTIQSYMLLRVHPRASIEWFTLIQLNFLIITSIWREPYLNLFISFVFKMLSLNNTI